jgi:CubicO group peptidase (beta-lactamase class C family)
MQKKMVNLFIAGILLFGAAQAQIPDEQNFTRQLDSFVQQVMKKIPVIPSLTVTIVNENAVLFNKAWGWADKESGIKADVNTNYYIASCTKAFTALAASLIDKEKKILLDSPMKKYFPRLGFKSDIGNDVSIRSLLTHTSGLENTPLVYRMAYSGSIERTDMLRLLADATMVRTKPGVYRYNNLGYNIYGLALQEYLNLKWQDVLQEKIFKPLGMNRTTAYMSLAKKNNWNIAQPYDGYGPGGLEKIELQKSDSSMQSAGGLITTPADIAAWLQAQINLGKINNRQIFPADIMKLTQTGVVQMERSGGIFTAQAHYAFGWQVSKYHDEKIIYHFGGYPGYVSHLSFMPDKKVGLAIFTNEGTISGAAPDLLSAFIYDWITNAKDPGLYTKKLDQLESMHLKEVESTQRSHADRSKRSWQLSMPFESYTGKYRHDLYGDIDISIENKLLAVRMGNLRAVSTPFTQPETIRIELLPGSGRVIAFKLDDQKKITGINYDGLEYMRVK